MVKVSKWMKVFNSFDNLPLLLCWLEQELNITISVIFTLEFALPAFRSHSELQYGVAVFVSYPLH